MRPTKIAPLVATVILSAQANAAQSGQRIVCPVSTAKLSAAAPVLGPPREPWGELHGSEATKTSGGGYITRYALGDGGVADEIEKWLVCYYRDQSYKVVKLPVTTKACTITTRPDGSVNPETKRPYFRILDITCR